ncbi:NAD-dependent epimerase/dehydratase family protein [Clostridium sartagoforme]|uniref:NAD-dependent epimerase/dehydratase family protein n=1 Tax=Clostridium sartagoforme TaxID=84031 RepID=A0A4S2DPD2_9CLOT|nr:NAD-dependent epimerase/dehydratase family protein [Clostridium sartagoforme]TGY44278.1 NAD-dependent epimerase/dehydratase family protein [Clostridium sartagoforme]
MKRIVLLGGNGYIGREVTRQWLKKDKNVEFYVISRSGNNKLVDKRIHNLSADVTDYNSVEKVLPKEIDCIIDFVGHPEKDSAELVKINKQPAEVMLEIAEKNNIDKIGFIGGILGPKSFTDIKCDIINMLKLSNKRVEYVEPTVVYGRDRKDALAKMVPVFKVLGVFSKKLKPVHVEDVANELITKLTK